MKEFEQGQTISQLMHEIKRRDYSIDQIKREPHRLFFRAVVVEYCFLQFRKICELLSYCTVMANKNAAESMKNRVTSDYHAEKTLRWMESRFGNVYPVPITQHMDPRPGVRADWKNLTEPFLTRTDFRTLYNRSGDILHSRSPLRKSIDYDDFHDQIGSWHTKLRSLLHTHTLRTFDDSYVYLIQMNTNDVEQPPSVELFLRKTD